MFNDYTIFPLGDSAITIEFGNKIDILLNQKIHALANALHDAAIEGVRDIIPAYTTITVVYDVLLIRKKSSSAFELMKNEIEKIMSSVTLSLSKSNNKKLIPVCYDISLGIDLENIAATKNLTVEEIIRLHTSKTYHVYMIGFLPGFAYMGSVHEQLITKRKDQPNFHVAAGSVGIAGEQTGIYPFNSPGGWNIIGRTPLQMFDKNREQPVLIEPGDEVQFQQISLEEFNAINEYHHY
jgi:inhibitor of KinA